MHDNRSPFPATVRAPARLVRTLAALLVASVLVLAAPAARADESAHSFGLGIELGAPTGLAMKYYLGSSGGRGGVMALQGGLGAVESWGPDGIHVHLEVVWHPSVLTTTPDFSIPFYLGVGGRILHWQDSYCYRENGNNICGGDGDTDLGLRVPFGLLMDFRKVPLDIFFELALVFDIVHIEDDDDGYDYDHDFLSLNGVLGVRYYF
jgi:hypothetical protein